MTYHREVRPLDFLGVRPREGKPRRHGLTHVLDKGMPPEQLAAALDSVAAYIDIWKFGWGTVFIDPCLPSKMAILSRHGVDACLGGTALEIAFARGKVAEYLAWAAETGFGHVEVSRGAVRMPLADKRRLIDQAAGRFVVLAEVGCKRTEDALIPRRWPDEAAADLDAGASLVVTEGRESGTAGIYWPDGSVREDILEPLLERVEAARLVFEAPRKEQQSWFIRRLGREVNLGNVPVSDALGLETLRLGLRSDTVDLLSAGEVEQREPAR
jgi:phosphosulfolactate synthase